MSTRPAQGSSSSDVTVYIHGSNTGSRKVSRRSIAESAMKNAKISFEIDGYRYSNSDWSKIMRLVDELEAVI